jgi:hypothetical protein
MALHDRSLLPATAPALGLYYFFADYDGADRRDDL